jgi:hypothetical protein
MGKKSSPAPIVNQERPMSPEELRMFGVQSDSMGQAMGIAQEQEARSAEGYQQYIDSYSGVETGMIDDNARRENGYTNGMSGDYAQAPTVAERRDGATYGHQPSKGA